MALGQKGGSSETAGSPNWKEGKSKPKNASGIWLLILYWGLVLSGIYFAYLNIQPYAKAVDYLSAKSVNQAFLYLVSVIPIINGIAAILGRGITWILGTILWGVIQIIEILPIILYNHEGFIQTIIGGAESRSKYQVKDGDDPTLRMLKRVYNSLPTSVVTNLERLRVFTYTVDFIICLSVYSPVASGKVTDFFWVLATGQWGKIDAGNLLLALITLLAIEAIVSLIIWVGKLSYAVKSSAK